MRARALRVAPAPDVGAEKPRGRASPALVAVEDGDRAALRERPCHGGVPAGEPPAARRRRRDASGSLDAMQLRRRRSRRSSPATPTTSYLVRKLRSDAASVGGVGTPMPIGDAALDEAEIQAIEAWIAERSAE